MKAGVVNIKEEKPKKKITLHDVIKRLEILNERGVINALSFQYNYMNATTDYTFVSFKIPKNNHKKEVIK